MSKYVRTPITGLRTPITGLRTPIRFSEPLDWDEQLSKFDNYIKFASKQVVSNMTSSCFYGADDLYQEGLLLLWQCFERYQSKGEEEFQYLFKSSLWRLLRSKANKSSVDSVDIEEVFDIGYSEDSLEEMYEEYRMKQVQDLLVGNPTAISILNELLNPSKVTVEECDKDMARKEMLKSQGIWVNTSTSVEVRPIHIQRALKLTEEMYVKNFKLIQMAVYEVYGKDCSIRSYIPNWDDPTWDELNYTPKLQSSNHALTNEELHAMLHTIKSEVDDLTEPITEAKTA